MSKHQRISILFIFAGLLFIGTTATVFGQASSKGSTSGADSVDPTVIGSIHGTVYLPSGHPVDNRVRIKLTSINNAGIDLYTDLEGHFQYDGLAPGNYKIEAAQEDASQGAATEDVQLQPGEHAMLMIYLKKPGEGTKDKTGSATVEATKPVPAKAKQEYDTAANLASLGQLTGAIVHFNNAIQIFPQYLDAHNDLGVAYLKLKRPDDAAAQFESAIEISPKSFNPRLNLGIILLGKHQYPEAVDQLTQCVSIDSSQASGHLYLGNALLGQDDLNGAKRELNTALDIGGAKFSVAHYYLGYVYIKSGDKQQAAHELETFLASKPDDLQMSEEARDLLQRLKEQ